LNSEDALRTRWEASHDVAARVNDLGWRRLVEIVYAEPTFVSMRPRGLGQPLRPAAIGTSNANALIRYVRYSLRRGPNAAGPSRVLLLDLLFSYLDQYARLIARD
jgi:hypothetical protein